MTFFWETSRAENVPTMNTTYSADKLPQQTYFVKLFRLGVLSGVGISKVGWEELQGVIPASELWLLLLGTRLHEALVFGAAI